MSQRTLGVKRNRPTQAVRFEEEPTTPLAELSEGEVDEEIELFSDEEEEIFEPPPFKITRGKNLPVEKDNDLFTFERQLAEIMTKARVLRERMTSAAWDVIHAHLREPSKLRASIKTICVANIPSNLEFNSACSFFVTIVTKRVVLTEEFHGNSDLFCGLPPVKGFEKALASFFKPVGDKANNNIRGFFKPRDIRIKEDKERLDNFYSNIKAVDVLCKAERKDSNNFLHFHLLISAEWEGVDGPFIDEDNLKNVVAPFLLEEAKIEEGIQQVNVKFVKDNRADCIKYMAKDNSSVQFDPARLAFCSQSKSNGARSAYNTSRPPYNKTK